MFINPVKLCMSIIYSQEANLDELSERLVRRWGEIESRSESILFDFSENLKQEMSAPLYRIFFSFKDLMSPDNLSIVQSNTKSLEREFTRLHNKRVFNIDVAYLDTYKLVFLHSKASPPRIYVGAGTYAEQRLFFMKDKVQALPWCLEDFKQHFYDDFFVSLRTLYQAQLSNLKKENPAAAFVPKPPNFLGN